MVVSNYAKLRRELSKYLDKPSIGEIRKAYRTAERAHRGQKRKSGEPYITHPVEVARILAKIRMDKESIIAALLHDVLEDTKLDKPDLESQFGTQVAGLVDGVSKLTQIKFESRAEAQAENFRKMVLAMTQDIRVIIIKLADRLHNMRTLSYLAANKQKRIAKETLEIYAPIATRLSIYAFAVEYEDLAFAILYPFRHRAIKEAVRKTRGNRKEILSVIEAAIEDCLEKNHIHSFSVWGREKHLFAIYRKMREKHLPLSEIMDVYTFRIIVESIDDCYRVLGLMHNLYKPVPARFRDYIAIPKANGYQSLHTTLFGPYGVPIEIQIRTQQMHKMSEQGIIAQWAEQDQGSQQTEARLRAQGWLKTLAEMQEKASTSLDFIENVKIDLFPDEIYVFTPRGDIMELPHGASAVDFAYAVHTDIGNHCIATKIDRHLAPLSTQLKTGQKVEIVTSSSSGPNPAWLDFAITAKARSSIKHYLKNQQHSESLALGQKLLERSLNSLSLSISDLTEDAVETVLEESQLACFDDLLENIGLGKLPPHLLARRLTSQVNKDQKTDKASTLEPLPIQGSEGMLVNFAGCCQPIPGDPIVGILGSGRGFTVHQEDCENIVGYRERPDEYLTIQWETDPAGLFETELLVEALDKKGTLAHIAQAISKSEANIKNIFLENHKGDQATLRLTITVKSRDHLTEIIKRIQQTHLITKVYRTNNRR